MPRVFVDQRFLQALSLQGRHLPLRVARAMKVPFPLQHGWKRRLLNKWINVPQWVIDLARLPSHSTPSEKLVLAIAEAVDDVVYGKVGPCESTVTRPASSFDSLFPD